MNPEKYCSLLHSPQKRIQYTCTEKSALSHAENKGSKWDDQWTRSGVEMTSNVLLPCEKVIELPKQGEKREPLLKK